MLRGTFLLLFFAILGLSLTGCLDDDCTRTELYIQYDPVFIPEDSIRPGIAVENARDLCSPGNIYYYNDMLLINERRQGIHVIDNSDPSNPVPLSFISIPGNLDMAVRNNVLYVDLYLDLVAIDITDVTNPKIIGRTDGVFSSWYPLIQGAGYLVDYVPTEKTMELDCNDGRIGNPWFRMDLVLFATVDMNMSAGTKEFADATGIAGSMARFALAKEHLYAIDEWKLRVFGLDAADPELKSTVDVGWGIETLFPYGDHLFIGANNGMFIYDNSDPLNPAFVSQFAHVQSCDPVFVKDDVAFVTLRSGNACQGFTNQLEVIDISDLAEPRLMRTYPMENPHGLSIRGDKLYLCEGESGLKVFDIENVNIIDTNMEAHITGFNAYDVIALPGDGTIMVIGDDGLRQFDASDSEKITNLSRININCR